MPILDPSGRPIYPAYPAPETPAQVARTIPTPFKAFKPTRQLKRGFLRMVAIAHINKHFGPEPKRVRKSLARDLAKRPQFIEEVRNATKAW